MRKGFDRVNVLHGGFEEWVDRGLPTQPTGPEWQVDSIPVTVATPASPETAPGSNPLDVARDTGL
jgi:3-mercaptopyruvate sulfurtransferase SseA